MSRRTKTPRIIPRHTERGIEIGPQNTSFGRDVTLVNPDARDPHGSDRRWFHKRQHRFILWFGACGPTRLMVWADSLDDALEECGDWIVKHAPGLTCTDQVNESYAEAYELAISEGKSEEEAQEHAWEESQVDTTSIDSGNHHLLSWEWGIDIEDPTREELDQFLYPTDIDWSRERDRCEDGSYWSECQKRRVRPTRENEWTGIDTDWVAESARNACEVST